MYDFLLAEFGASGAYAPLIAGSAARAVAVVATSPLELLKTRIQAAGAGTALSSRATAGVATPFSAAVQQLRSDMKVAWDCPLSRAVSMSLTAAWVYDCGMFLTALFECGMSFTAAHSDTS